jgi:hypothetical protein
MQLVPSWQRIFASVCMANLGFALGYLLPDYLRVPRLFYFPFEREWRLTEPVPGVPMGYVGLWSWALLFGAVGFGLTWLALSRKKSPLVGRTLGLFAAWSGTATVLALAYFTWNNWP